MPDGRDRLYNVWAMIDRAGTAKGVYELGEAGYDWVNRKK